jgi:nucleoside-diphosphate-sugar epimerase
MALCSHRYAWKQSKSVACSLGDKLEMGILLTGADGYFGINLLQFLLKETDQKILAWVRAKDSVEFEGKKNSIKRALGGKDNSRIEYYYGDLRAEKPFGTIPAAEVKSIIHGAAVTRFNVEEDLAKEVNELGTVKLLDFAKSTKITKFLYVSTLYTSGLKKGDCTETSNSTEGPFANFYERSKCFAESHVMKSGLPWTIARVSTAICDDLSGRVEQYNVFHNTLKLLYHGLISLMPGEEKAKLYFVAGNLACEWLGKIYLSDSVEKIFHVTHDGSEALTLADLLDSTFEVFNTYDKFRERNILRPMFIDYETFKDLSGGLEGFSGNIVQQGLSSITPFARQLYVSKDVSNASLRSLLGKDYLYPNFNEVIPKTVKYLVDSKWGRIPQN